MSGTLTYLGGKSIANILPTLTAALTAQLPALQGQLKGLLSISAALTVSPPSLGGTITAALKTVASLQAALAGGGGVAPPGATLQAAAVLGQIAALTGMVASINAQISLLSASGIAAYSYVGTVDGLGSSLSGALSGGLPTGGAATDSCHALALITATPATWTAMQAVFSV